MASADEGSMLRDAPAASAAPSFSPRAWLALLPSPASPGSPLARTIRPADPAAAAREADPMTRPRLYRYVGTAPRLLFRGLDYLYWERVNFGLPEFTLTMLVRLAACIAPLWVFSDGGLFSTSSKAFGSAALGLYYIGFYMLVYFTATVPRSNLKLRWWEPWRPLAENRDAPVDFYPASVVARYDELAQRGVGDDPGAKTSLDERLLAHVEGDAECSCPRPGCAGDLWQRWTPSVLALAALQVFLELVSGGLAEPYTAMVTLAGSSWTAAWSAVMLVLALVGAVHLGAILAFYTMGVPTEPLLQLSRRLHARATCIALDDLLESYRRKLLLPPSGGRDGEYGVGATAGAEADPGTPQLYAVLHWNLEPRWKAVHYSLFFYVYMGLGRIGMLVVPTLLVAASGPCVPFWIPAHLLFNLFLAFFGLFLIAASNASIDHLSGLQSEAALHARGLLALSASFPRNEARVQAEGELARHAEALHALARAGEAARARVAGVAVTKGGLRTLLVTVATVGFAVWGVARGLGVRATLETVCPAT